MKMSSAEHSATVIVIGAGQAGLSAGFHLKQRDFLSALDHPNADNTFVILDADEAPGGAWQHRWESLTMRTVNGIFDLPGFPRPPIDPEESSRTAVPRYFADFEAQLQLPILRPVTVTRVSKADRNPHGELIVETSAGVWQTRAIINATGTWNNPVLPQYPDNTSFLGQQLHSRDYIRAEDFAGKRVAIVGGGISAVQQLEEISRHATVFWYTRREPVFIEGDFRPEFEGRQTIEQVTADAEAGRPTGSVVSYTGLMWSDYALAAKERGALERRPMFQAIEPHGLREADGSFTSVDVILWATGYKASLAHLEPLQLRNGLGGITVRGTQVLAEPRVQLVGFGPSQSTVGANRAGRDAVATLRKFLGESASSTQ